MAKSTIYILLALVAVSAAQDCTWNMNGDLPLYQPLYINPNSPSLDIRGFWLPQSGDIVTVPVGEQVLMACTNGNFPEVLKEELLLTCIGNNMWQEAGGATYTWAQLYCNKDAFHMARYTGNQCPINMVGDLREVEIGFQINNGNFYKLLTTCLKYDTSDSLYSWFTQVPEIAGHQSGVDRPSFSQGVGFYPTGMNVDTLYTQASQTDAVALAVGSAALAGDYIQAGTDFYMSRGHLAAKADFIYGSHQRATFWFMNVGPQFQTFNGGNWQIMEADMQRFAEQHPNDLHIYTGTHSINELLDINGAYAKISLDFLPKGDPTGINILRSPSVFWKVVHDTVDGRGVAFLGLNNPYEDRTTDLLYSLCPDVCDQLNYITWNPTDQVAGYAICCEVDPFLLSVPEMPTITVTGLLTGH